MKFLRKTRNPEYKQCLVWCTRLTRVTSLKVLTQLSSPAAAKKRENKQLPNAWQDHRCRSLSNLKKQVWKFSDGPRNTNHIAFPTLIKTDSIN